MLPPRNGFSSSSRLPSGSLCQSLKEQKSLCGKKHELYKCLCVSPPGSLFHAKTPLAFNHGNSDLIILSDSIHLLKKPYINTIDFIFVICIVQNE